MIILSDDIIFRKAVIHLLNVELGKFAPAQDLFMMQPDVIELVRKQKIHGIMPGIYLGMWTWSKQAGYSLSGRKKCR